MKKIITFTFFLFLALSPVIYAQEATEPASINEVTENIRERLQDTLDNSLPSSPRLYGYVGVVRDIIKNTVVIEDKDGRKNVTVREDSQITRSPGSAKIKVDSIRIDDYIIAIGEIKGDDLLGTKLIVSADSFDPPKKISGIGILDKVTKSTLSVTSRDGSLTLELTKNTVYKSGSGLIELADLEVGDSLVYAGLDDEGDYTATQIMRIKSAE